MKTLIIKRILITLILVSSSFLTTKVKAQDTWRPSDFVPVTPTPFNPNDPLSKYSNEYVPVTTTNSVKQEQKKPSTTGFNEDEAFKKINEIIATDPKIKFNVQKNSVNVGSGNSSSSGSSSTEINQNTTSQSTSSEKTTPEVAAPTNVEYYQENKNQVYTSEQIDRFLNSPCFRSLGFIQSLAYEEQDKRYCDCENKKNINKALFIGGILFGGGILVFIFITAFSKKKNQRLDTDIK